jgi:hypothetical protein
MPGAHKVHEGDWLPRRIVAPCTTAGACHTLTYGVQMFDAKLSNLLRLDALR